MVTVSKLHTAQYRLAEHYLAKLRTAAAAVRRGHANAAYGLSLLDREWEQIKHWQTWATHQDDEKWTHLCKEFAFAGSDALAMRVAPQERMHWWEDALRAARRLNDRNAEARILPNLALILSSLGDLEKAERLAVQLTVLAKETGVSLQAGQALYLLGTIFEDRGDFQKATHYYEGCLEIFRQVGADTNTGRAYLGLGSVATSSGDYQSAYIHFLQYLKLVDVAGKEIDLCIALQAVSEALQHLKRHTEAESYLQRSVQISRALNYQWALGSCLIALGVCAIYQDKMESARSYLEEGLDVARAFSSKRDIIHGLSNLGRVHAYQADFEAALTYLEEGLIMAREAGLPFYECSLVRRMADVHLAIGEFETASRELHEALTMAQDLGVYPEKIHVLSSIMGYCHRLGWSEQAAILVGFLIGDPEVDERLLMPVCVELEAALGSENYQRAIEHGKGLQLDAVLSEVMMFLSKTNGKFENKS